MTDRSERQVNYVVVHANRSMQIAATGKVVPPGEVAQFRDALECATSLGQLLASERKRIDDARTEAQLQGFEAGSARAFEELGQEFASSVARLAGEFEAHQAAARQAVTTLALAIVRKVVPTLGADVVVPGLLQHALSSFVDERPLRARVHPSAVETIVRKLSELDVVLPVMGDDTLNPYDCVLDTAHGRLVASLDEQLDAIERVLVDPAQVRQVA